MNPETIPIWLAIAAQIGLGLSVFRANHRSYSNQSFLLLLGFICAWLLSLEFAFSAPEGAKAEIWIRNASACGILILNGFYLLRYAIVCRDRGRREIARRLMPLVLISLPGLALCYSKGFLRSAVMRFDVNAGHLVPEPVYGPLFPVVTAFIVIGAAIGILGYIKDLRRSAGMQKVELQFVVVGGATLVILFQLGLFMQPVLPRIALVVVAPFRV